MKNKEWLEVEHNIRFLLDKQEHEMTIKDFVQIDFLKSAIIALFGCKVFNDTNETFYYNMRHQIKTSVEYLSERFPEDKRRLENIKNFILENL